MTAGSRDRLRAWVEVDVDALRRNAARVAEHVSPARLIPMIKADGYGLGAVRIAHALLPSDPFAFGVATVDEGIELRDSGIESRIIVFTPVPAMDAPGLVEHSLDAAVLGRSGLAHLASTGIDLHIEIDSGMGRAGFEADDVAEWGGDLEGIAASGRLVSVYTHFHSAGTDEAATERQLRRYEAAVDGLRFMPGSRIARHVANSAAIRSDRQYHLDLVRPGLYLFGGGRG
ncbi:MAG: alanine racemase, partial [Gemmatimonadota bacterium]